MLIAIEGCIGAGKSTVARGLAALRQSQLLLEDFESNPFLRSFYEDPLGNAFETEFAFLLLHFHQLKSHAISGGRKELVSDFHLGKDLLYAELNLEDARAKVLFAEMYDYCSNLIAPPELMICLSASTNLIVERIKSRNRDFELEINFDYYSLVNETYENFFMSYQGKKILLPMDEWDFVGDPTLFEKLSLLVDQELAAGE